MLVVKVEHKGVRILPQSSPVQVRAATPTTYLKLAFYFREKTTTLGIACVKDLKIFANYFFFYL